jgi:single-strand DNA-binding protein
MSLNKAMLIGHVGQDPEIRTVGETKVASFRLATTETWKDKSGEMKSDTQWHSCSVWGKQAEIVEKYIKKGSPLYVEGGIRYEKYTDKNQVEKVATKIKVDQFKMIGAKPTGTSTGSTPEAASGHENNQVDDDLPF